MNNYKELKVWQKSIGLVESVYKVASTFPKEEKYGLTTQLILSVKVGYVKENYLDDIFNLITEIQKMNYSLIKKFSNI